ncbi:MAG: heavy metal translocating P-type ATPase [Phycisphaeraceae bacterium]
MTDTPASETASCDHCGLPVPRSRLRRGGEASAFCCFGCHIVQQMVRAGENDQDGTATSPLMLRLGMGVFLAMNIMAFSGFFYSQQVYGNGGSDSPAGSLLASVFSYLLLLLCTLVIVLLGGPLIGETLGTMTVRNQSGSRRPWAWRIDVNSLILMGVLAAFVLSAVNTVRGSGHLYYDTAAMILVLVTLGGYLDARAKRKAAASGESLLASLPSAVTVRLETGESEMQVAAVEPGRIVRVRPGETIAIDGDVVEGTSHVDESVLTGESRHRVVSESSRVLAGAMNMDGLLWVRASSKQGERVIDQVKRLLEEARRRQPAIQRTADRIASMFVPLVMLLAGGVLLWHTLRGDAGAGLFTSLSVLLISCPCALGLAAPLACYNALARASRHGMLVDSPATLEKLASIGAILFDKTGTLTRGRMTVSHIVVAEYILPDDAISLAASLESASNHPIASAIVDFAKGRGLNIPSPQQARVLPGLGIAGVISDRMLRLGSLALAQQTGAAEDPLLLLTSEDTAVYLLEGSRALARFTLADESRPEAAQVLSSLRSVGMTIRVLTGDDTGPAQQLAALLNVDVLSRLLPGDKVAHLESERRVRKCKIAFVGDGINDAPVMGAADVGIAVGNATDLARQAGHVHLMGEGLDRLPFLFALARDAVRRVRMNLLWAFGYNAIGLTLATMGLLSPIFAASSMVVSSLLIVWTSSRPWREDNNSDGATEFNTLAGVLSPSSLYGAASGAS